MSKSMVTSVALTIEQREIIQAIADKRYGGNIGLVIRAALSAQYPKFARVSTIPKRGRPGPRTERVTG